MFQHCNSPKAPIAAAVLIIGALTGSGLSHAAGPFAPSIPPERCWGYGDLQSLSLTDWESGLGSWTAGRRNVANPPTFDTPDWAVTGNLPDLRAGSAAFVPNLSIGNCSDDDEAGVLTLTSPSIAIPAGVEVPRISLKHWFEIEYGWDGGNLRISVNNGSFQLIPASAIQMTTYQATLYPAKDEFGVDYNTNPLAGQQTFTGTPNGEPSGSWVESRINLLGIANAGDTIRLRFDFGVDSCSGEVGWYVDDVEFYYCPAELPPSNCGNGRLNGNEQCDDGNNYVGDGCSNTCKVEAGFLCADPTSAAAIPDSSFEAGTPNPYWTELSNRPSGTPICRISTCGTAGGTGPSDGTYWVFLGGLIPFQEGSVAQSITIPPTVSTLTFDLEVPVCDSPSDYVEVLIDGNQELLVDGSSPLCGIDGYTKQFIDVRGYNDGASHDLEFHSITTSENGYVSNFFIDKVELPGDPSICRRQGTSLTLVKRAVNDDGGEALTSEWTLAAAGPSGFSGPGPVVWGGDPFTAGTYDLSEAGGPSEYNASDWECWGGSQVDADTVSVATGQAVTCTITNDDRTPTLTVVNTITNDDGGLVTDPQAFGLKVDGLDAEFGVALALNAGDYVLSAAGLPGYSAGPWGGDCAADGSIALPLGADATCTIVHDDIAPLLTLLKTIVNDDDGTITDRDAFGLQINGATVLHGVAAPARAGANTVSELGMPGYVPGVWGGDCDPDGGITLELAQSATCTITNNDVDRTSLTLINQVVNDNGGTAPPSAWTLSAFGPSNFSGTGPNVYSGQGILPGSYSLSESAGVSGYSTGTWNCVGGNQTDASTVSLAVDEVVTCTIVSNDVAPTLTVVKSIVNDNGGTQTDPNAFGLRLDGILIQDSVANVVDAGGHSVSEDGLPEYQAEIWGGDCGPDGSISLLLAETAVCTIVNNDIAPTVTVINTIVNDNGGSITNPNAFGLRIDGVSKLFGVPIALNTGPHTLTQIGVSGYLAGTWGGDCALDGTVTLALGESATCTITNDDISPTLTVVKNIVNDNGGDVTDPNDFGLMVDGQPILHNATNPFDAGAHLVSETGLPGYVAGFWGGNCAFDGSITLAPGQNAVCSVTNNDSNATRLHLVVNVKNNNGGTATSSAWTLTAAGPAGFSGSGPIVDSGTGLLPGTYDLSISGPTGYRAGDWECDAGTQVDGDTVSLALGESSYCTVTVDDIAPRLTLSNNIINDDGGTVTDPNAFALRINGSIVANQTSIPLSVGSYTVSQSGLPGYEPGLWGGDCATDGTISLALGETATCSITNDDIAPTLRVYKNIVNDNGGPVTDPDAFGLKIDGNLVAHDVDNPVDAGPHTVSEEGLPGYAPGVWSSPCNPDGTITLALAQNATCSITNTYVATTSLTLVKQVIRDHGGSALGSDWTLTATGPTGFSGPGPLVSSEIVTGFLPGTYELSESGGPSGYSAGNWVCVGGSQTGNTILLEAGEAATCTITNDDIPATLTLVKSVSNSHGGQASEDEWTLIATGTSIYSATTTGWVGGKAVAADTYVLSESGPDGYQPGPWQCTGEGQVNGSSITLALGESATCSLENSDIAPTLTLVKQVTNDNGGQAAPDDWTLVATGANVYSATTTGWTGGKAVATDTYTLSESDGPGGYTAGGWSCTGSGSQNGNQITLTFGQSATCTITNDDQPPSLTLDKVVINDNGGPVQPSAWTLSASGETPLSGPGAAGNTDVQSGPGFKAGTYTLSESAGPGGYSASGWSCSGGSQDGNQITLTVGETATCTITNDDQVPSLTLNKVVINDSGGTAPESAWTLSASGPTPLSGPGAAGSVDVQSGPGFKAGTYTLSESGGPGAYSASAWSCSGGSQNGNQVNVAVGQNVSCTITNDDSQPSLTLVKQVTNNDGGTAQPSAWTLTATGPGGSGFSGTGPTVYSGAGFQAGSYDLTESGGPDGYTASAWVCIGGTQNDADTVTIDLGQSATCTIANNDIPPSLTLVKQVVNDNGGTAIAPNWTLQASGVTGFSGKGPTVSSGAGFEAGTYDLSETNGPSGYSAGAWDCVGGTQNDADTVTVGSGQSVTCTITNNDQAPSLTLNKVVINDDGGTAQPSAWTLSAAGPTPLSGPGAAGSNDVQSGPSFTAGTYVLTETGGPSGYSASGWSCSGVSQNGNQITLGPGQVATCTITNNDRATSLILDKVVINDNGGTAQPSAWTLSAAGPTPLSGPGAAGSTDVQSGPGFAAGTYTLSESGGPGGYSASAWNCSGGSQNGNQITLTLGQSATCTITNNDQPPSLTLDKVVTNDNGGTALPSAWTLAAAGPTPLSGPGAAGSSDVQSGPTFAAGTYTLSESGGPSGYSASAWSCSGGSQNGNQITLDLGQSATCTITNNDQAPSLTLDKVVTNNNGGTAQPSAWTLTADGPTPLSGPGAAGSTDVQSGPGFAAGSYTLSESGGPDGYSASAWSCTGGSQNGDQITLALGQTATCTITNDDDGSGLTLIKQVTNDNGGTAQASAWTLTATGPTGFSGPGPTVSNGDGFQAGTYDLSESDGPGGYTAGAWTCVGGTQIGNQITLGTGESATCTIINNDQPPGLTLDKVVTNDNGGTAQPSAWTLAAAGPTPLSGPGAAGNSDVQSGPTFAAGTYTLSESGGPNGYSASAWNCSGGSQNGDQITLALGQTATCTISNNDQPPSLTLDKVVTNDNGGTAQPSAWTLAAAGPTPLSGPGAAGSSDVQSGPTFAAGTYTLSESGGPSGYSASAWSCSGGSQNGNQITLALGQSAACTITNNDQAPSLTLNKVVTNNNGGTELPSAWTLSADGPTPLSGPGAAGNTDVQSGPTFAAGTYTLAESAGPNGYNASAWSCSGGSQNGNQITLTLGQSATCTITNNDQAPSLTLNKVVTNNNGGTALPSAWTLSADGPTPLSGPGAAGNADVQSGPTFAAGTYTLSESAGPDGYNASAWSCSGGSQNGDQITLALGQSATCTITNDDDGPGLTLIKQVTNDNGGTAQPSAWTLMATGPTGFSGPGPTVSNGEGFQAGMYALSESDGPDGYTAGAWVCIGGTQIGSQITLGTGESATCTITNNDQAPSLTLVKQVINNDGGTAVPANWTLAANGPGQLSGSGPTVSSGAAFKAGSYTLSESGGPPGYDASDWVCTGVEQDGPDTITLYLGESASCTITNDDVEQGALIFRDGFESN